MKWLRYLIVLICVEANADIRGLSIGVAGGITDDDSLDSVNRLDLSYEYWWDGGFKLAYQQYQAPNNTGFDTSSLSIFYQNAVNDFLIFDLGLAAMVALEDSPYFDYQDTSAVLEFGVQWRINNQLAVNFASETIFGLGDLDKFTNIYLGLRYWPLAGEAQPLVFKKLAPNTATSNLDWQEIAALPAAEPQPSPIPKKIVKPVHHEVITDDDAPLSIAEPPPGYYYVQIGTYSDQKNVKRAASSAQYSGFDIFTETLSDRNLVRVMAGSFNDRESAKQAQSLIWRMFDDKPLIVKR